MSTNLDSFTSEEAESLARKMDDWSSTLESGELGLLMLLLASYGKAIPQRDEDVDTDSVRNSIRESVLNAVRRFIDTQKQELINIQWRR